MIENIHHIFNSCCPAGGTVCVVEKELAEFNQIPFAILTKELTGNNNLFHLIHRVYARCEECLLCRDTEMAKDAASDVFGKLVVNIAK